MRILHINTYDTGGAANACLRIHKALLRKGIDSKVLVLCKLKSDPDVFEFNFWDNAKTRIERFLKRRKWNNYKRRIDRMHEFIAQHPVEIFTSPSTIFDITTHPLYKEADLIQLNWTSGFLDESSFFKKNTKPVVWRMPDLYVCGGGYHYERGFPFDIYNGLLKANSLIRYKALKGKNINYVAISNWVKQKALDSKFINGQPVYMIHNGIDASVFKQYDRDKIRIELGLPHDKIIILFGAASLSNPRKGTSFLLDAIKDIKNDRVKLYGFGDNKGLEKNITTLGFIKDEGTLAKIYSAVDLFVMSSVEEAFGQVFIESMACGTPVVSFPNGGALDVIIEGFNGVIANDFTPDSLLEAINKALWMSFDRKAIRQYVLEHFDINEKTEQYIELYKSILENK